MRYFAAPQGCAMWRLLRMGLFTPAREVIHPGSQQSPLRAGNLSLEFGHDILTLYG
jgi:hypothetical protein